MRRLFIVRKDLHMSTGKISAQLMHCAEAYWTRLISNQIESASIEENNYKIELTIDKDVVDGYIGGIFTKTVCEAKNKSHLLKVKTIADELGLIENQDYGFIYDKCFTELIPEEEDGTTLTCAWFAPLSDEVSHKLSKKYQLYKG